MAMLADLVEVVIGVDTHSQTRTAAVVDARTGGVLARATVTADPDGCSPPASTGSAIAQLSSPASCDAART